MAIEKGMDKDEEIECLKQKVSNLHTRLGMQTDESNRYRAMNDEQWTRLKSLENQVTDAENSLRDFKNAVMIVVKELAKE